ncbi:MAG: PIN domain-containing protein [Acidimicrobiia bacterium]
MSDRVILDSTVLIDALRGYPAADRIRAMRRSKVQLWVSPISIEEIWRGLHPEEQTSAARLIDAIRLAPIDRSVAKTAGSWRRQYAALGTTLHRADCLIAASAQNIGARLATGNPSDFPMDEITVEHWPVGE